MNARRVIDAQRLDTAAGITDEAIDQASGCLEEQISQLRADLRSKEQLAEIVTLLRYLPLEQRRIVWGVARDKLAQQRDTKRLSLN